MLDNINNRTAIIKVFPLLANDSNLCVKSEMTSNYNCIAYAGLEENMKWWPHPTKIDGIYWPSDIPCNTQLSTFILLFNKYEYDICDDYVFESGYQKIAIYCDEVTKECTHAARQLRSGIWVSKLGDWWDIQHSTPYEMESNAYGKVSAFMKRKNNGFIITPQSKKRGK